MCLALLILSLIDHVFLDVYDYIAQIFSLLECLMANSDLPGSLLLETLLLLLLFNAILSLVNVGDRGHLHVLPSDDRGNFLVAFFWNENRRDVCYIAALPEEGAGVGVAKVDGEPDVVVQLVLTIGKLFFFLLLLDLLLPRI